MEDDQFDGWSDGGGHPWEEGEGGPSTPSIKFNLEKFLAEEDAASGQPQDDKKNDNTSKAA